VTFSRRPDVMIRGGFAPGGCKKLKLTQHTILLTVFKKSSCSRPQFLFLWLIQFRHVWYLRYILSTYFSSKIVWY